MMIDRFFGKYRPFSNFWFLRTPVFLTEVNNGRIDGIRYPTVEHAFQAAKSLDHNDRIAIGERIHDPIDAKAYGRTIQIRPDWESIKLGVMLDLVRQKFNNSAELRDLLLSTGDQQLIEGNNWHDNVWGICYCNVCSDQARRGIYTQDNNLGIILMQVRGELRG